MTNQAIKRAAELLREDAEVIRFTNTLADGSWVEDEDRKDYEARVTAAQQLEQMQ